MTCRICLSRVPVHSTTLTQAMRAAILQYKENNYKNMKDTYTDSGSYHSAYNETCSIHDRNGYCTSLWVAPIRLVVAPPVQLPPAAPGMPQLDTAIHFAHTPQLAAFTNPRPSAHEHPPDHAYGPRVAPFRRALAHQKSPLVKEGKQSGLSTQIHRSPQSNGFHLPPLRNQPARSGMINIMFTSLECSSLTFTTVSAIVEACAGTNLVHADELPRLALGSL